MKHTNYICFLRAINVGGNNIIKMDKLKNIFVDLGFENVDSYIQTGNVFFSSDLTEKSTKQKIQAAIKQKLKLDIEVGIIKFSRIKKLAADNPANDKRYNKAFKIYVGFFMNRLARKPKLPITTPDKAYELVYPDTELVLLIRHTETGNYKQYKDLTDKTLPTAITLRTWNVVEKIVQKWN